jgi:hypothetical protein
MLLANHGALTLGRDLFSAYYKMETIEHFAKISLVARMLGGEHVLSREEVFRLQDLRGRYGIAAPAPICAGDAEAPAECQVVQAPSSPGQRLVPEHAAFPEASGGEGRRRSVPAGAAADQEIRLTYGELTALIEDAIRHLR